MDFVYEVHVNNELLLFFSPSGFVVQAILNNKELAFKNETFESIRYLKDGNAGFYVIEKTVAGHRKKSLFDSKLNLIEELD